MIWENVYDFFSDSYKSINPSIYHAMQVAEQVVQTVRKQSTAVLSLTVQQVDTGVENLSNYSYWKNAAQLVGKVTEVLTEYSTLTALSHTTEKLHTGVETILDEEHWKIALQAADEALQSVRGRSAATMETVGTGLRRAARDTGLALRQGMELLLTHINTLFPNPSLGLSKLLNLRSHFILAKVVPDFSNIARLCTNQCENCSVEYYEVFCRVCCPANFPEPVLVTSLAWEAAHTLAELVKSASSPAWRGLRTVYAVAVGGAGRGEGPEKEDGTGLASVVRRFEWRRQLEAGHLPDPAFLHNTTHATETEQLLSADKLCGYYETGSLKQGRVMGGAVVGVAGRQFPWQLSLSTGWLGMFYQHRCGAALITRRHALTAAHCLAGRGSWWSLPGAGLYLLAGFRTHQQRDTAAVGRVVRYTLHPQFVSSTYEQDIAVLELSRPFLLSPAVLPVCMPAPSLSRPAHYTSLVGRPAWLSGWGRRWGGGPLASQLQAVLLPVLDNYQCMAWYNGTGLPQYIPASTFLCAGWRAGGRDACSGDSGGPLVVERATDGRAEVVGLVSWGVGCGEPGRPGVYTRVAQFAPWVWMVVQQTPTSP